MGMRLVKSYYRNRILISMRGKKSKGARFLGSYMNLCNDKGANISYGSCLSFENVFNIGQKDLPITVELVDNDGNVRITTTPL
jgi:hypothetical protein